MNILTGVHDIGVGTGGGGGGLASFPGSCGGGVEGLVHTVYACSATPGFLSFGILHHNIIPSIAVLLFITDTYKLSKMVLSQEPSTTVFRRKTASYHNPSE